MTQATNANPEVQNLRICFIDNEEDERNEIRETLKNYGKTDNWIVVDYSAEIFQRAVNNEFDILVCDYKMPRKDGISVLEEIRNKNKKIILALYTAFAISESSDSDLRCIKSVIIRFKKYDGVGCLLGTLQNQQSWIRGQIEQQFPANINPMGFLQAIKSRWKNRGKSQGGEDVEIKYETVVGEISAEETVLQKLEGPDSDAIRELGQIILDLASDLITDLERSTEQDAYITHSKYGNVTIAELKVHIQELSPLGIEHLKYWLKSRRRLKKTDK